MIRQKPIPRNAVLRQVKAFCQSMRPCEEMPLAHLLTPRPQPTWHFFMTMPLNTMRSRSCIERRVAESGVTARHACQNVEIVQAFVYTKAETKVFQYAVLPRHKPSVPRSKHISLSSKARNKGPYTPLSGSLTLFSRVTSSACPLKGPFGAAPQSNRGAIRRPRGVR